MTDTIHIMLDLETWGKAPGCDLRSIGACVFDPLTGTVGMALSPAFQETFYIATDNPIIDSPLDGFTNGDCWSKEYFDPADRVYRKYALKRYPDTVQWWNDQSEEAHAAFADPVDLREALMRFGVWFRSMIDDIYVLNDPTHRIPDNIRLWSHGPAFDPPILAAAYAAVGLPVPWHYRAPRDTRTLFDVSGIDPEADGSYRTFMTAYNTGTAHHALDDAIAQAKSVCGAYQRLHLPHDVLTHRDAWRSAISEWSDHTRDDNGSGYYTHELRAFDRTFDALAQFPRFDEGVIATERERKPVSLDDAPWGWTFLGPDGNWHWSANRDEHESVTEQRPATGAEQEFAARIKPDYEAAWREMHNHLSWMEKAGMALGLDALGRNHADIANRLISHAYPELRPFIDGRG